MFKAFIKSTAEKHIDARVEELLSAMSLSEKIGQMMQVERSSVTPQDIQQFHIGSVLSASGSLPEDNSPLGWLAMIDAFYASENRDASTKPQIPLLYGADAIHGHAHVEGATIFPHNIGLGAANSAKLNAKIAEVTAKEVLASGVNWVFGPNLCVAKDYHWGRVYESYSQDSKLVGEFAHSYIKQLQKPIQGKTLVACMKHWVGDGGTLYGIDQGETSLPYEELYQHHIAPFVEGIKAGALTVMVSFSSWNLTKCHGNHVLINDILKRQLQFKGFVVSDMEGIEYLSESMYSAVAIAVNAGVDMFMSPKHWRQLIDYLKSHIELGTVSINRINDAVRRILYVKIKSGLFDLPTPQQLPKSVLDDFGCSKHRALARKAVQKSLVLLKNEANLLPLKKSARVFVAGKSAHNIGNQCGGFTIDWQGVSGNDQFPQGSSIWQGIKRLSPSAHLSNSPIGDDCDPEQYDVAIVVVGEVSYAEGLGDLRINDNHIVETGSMIDGSLNFVEPYGTSLKLRELHPEDLSLIKNIKKKGVKVVTVLISGRPLIVNKELKNSSAFVAGWLPGSEGQGVADVLFGDVNFKGKLAFNWPKKMIFKDKEPSKTIPAFEQGFGLNY